jgi:hypothetical protein
VHPERAAQPYDALIGRTARFPVQREHLDVPVHEPPVVRQIREELEHLLG